MNIEFVFFALQYDLIENNKIETYKNRTTKKFESIQIIKCLIFRMRIENNKKYIRFDEKTN